MVMSSMRILIIEDSRPIAQALRRGLKSKYIVDVADTGLFGLNSVVMAAYDVILLDLNLPDMSGKEVCKRLRRHGHKMPILVLTGSGEIQDKVELLDIGADDYVVKPFSLDEVRARIRAALRRTVVYEAMTPLIVGILELDPGARSAKRSGVDLDLRRKEFDILEYLMRNEGNTVTRAMIIERIWDASEDLWANVVDVHIKHLRDKVDRPFASNLIKTVHGVGYKLEAEC